MTFDVSVFLKRYWYPLAASALILCGIAVRLALTLLGWPHTNSEEGTMGLEAMHILRGEYSIYLYGQNYLGAVEAYLGAAAFRVFGISLVALRLGMIALYGVFMLGVWWLAHLLYSRRVALISLAALIFGTPFLVKIELLADGGKAETLAFGALMFALATWLALTRPGGGEITTRQQWWLRVAAFVVWGIVAGLGLFTYAIIAPFVLTSGLLLAITCWRELRGWRWALPVAGLLVGLLPAFIYTATAPFKDNPVAVFFSLHQSLNGGSASGIFLLAKQFSGALFFTLPTVTGLASLYPVQALPLFGPPSGATWLAVLLGGGWSVAYLALLAMATYRPFAALRRERLLRQSDKHGDSAGDIARLLLTLTAWLTIALYLFSATAANNPNSGRYMIGLLVIVPAVLWPRVERAPRPVINSDSTWKIVVRVLWRPLAWELLAATLLLGIVGVVQAMPADLAADRADVRFAHELLDNGITQFYSDYWTCDLMNFATREQLTCAVVTDYGQPGLTRYAPYYATVHANPNAAYVLPHGGSIERTFLIQAAANHQHYQMRYRFGRYAVYLPTAP